MGFTDVTEVFQQHRAEQRSPNLSSARGSHAVGAILGGRLAMGTEMVTLNTLYKYLERS